VSSVHGMIARDDYCGLFSLLSRISKQGSDDDNKFLALFTQQFSGTSNTLFVCSIHVCDNGTWSLRGIIVRNWLVSNLM